MKKSTLAICLILSNSALASNAIDSAFIRKQVSNELQCIEGNKIDESNLNLSSNPNSIFLLSDSYCINKIDTKKSAAPSSLLNRNEVNNLFNRYYDAYMSLETLEDKVLFVDLFLQKSTNRYFATPSISRNDKSLKINFYRKGRNGSTVGHSLSLFPNTPLDSDLENKLKAVSKRDKTTESKLSSLVDSVLAPKKKLKSLSQLPIETQNCDSACQDREHDQEHEDWAEEQAENWCDTCDYFWEDDHDAGERYLIIFDDYGGAWDAYHYSPWDEDWWS